MPYQYRGTHAGPDAFDATEKFTPQPCGTRAAYARHERAGERPCPACRQARAKYDRDRKAARRGEKALA